MRIAIDARGVNWYKGTGIGTYTEKILKYIISNYKDDEYLLFWSGEGFEDFKRDNSEIIMASKRYHRFFEQNYFPYSSLSKNIDIFHVPQNGLGINENIKCSKVVTIHDIIPYVMPETVGKGYLSKFLREMPKILEESDAIITVSNYSKKDILRFFPGIDENKIFVTHLAAENKFKPISKEICKLILKEKLKIDCPFILYLGGFSERKNVKLLIECFCKVRKSLNEHHKLVISGALKDEGQALVSLCSHLKITEDVIFTGFMEEHMLPYLYNGCSLFIYPSLYEGFGLPPLEAMSCGTPVITSNTSSIPEIVGDGGIIVNPYSSNDICNAIVLISNDEEKRTELSKKALKKAANFSWEKTAEETMKVYSKLNSERQPLPSL